MTRRPPHFVAQHVMMSFDVPGSDAYSEAVAASGTIVCATKAEYIDAETITISDGFRSVVFEIDVAGDGVVAGNVQVNVSTDTTAAEVAARLKTAIDTAMPGLTTTRDTATLTIVNDLPGAFGNVTITDTVVDATHTSTGMSGGLNATGNTIADTVIKLFKATGPFRLTSAKYINPTGLAADASNYFNLKLLNGSDIMANWSTLTGAQGTIAADTFVDLVLSSTSLIRVMDAGDVMSLSLDETGTAVLPPGRIVVEGLYL